MRFFTASGELLARVLADGWVQIEMPAMRAEHVTPPGALLDSLGLTDAVAVARSRLDYLIEVPSADLLRDLQPNFSNLANLGTRGVMVTSVGDGLYDMVSRFFAPSVGVNEDSVTGSAHCALGPYWAEKLGKSELLAYQASKRGGVLRVEVRDDRVLLAGQAVTVLRCALQASATGVEPATR
jgi:predicted PhzF superfamily epimerase YddE/YHI9